MSHYDAQQFLKQYHKLSRRFESMRAGQLADSEAQKTYNHLTLASRELVSRCILLDDPRSFIFLLEQLGIILRLIGELKAADCLHNATQLLGEWYKKL